MGIRKVVLSGELMHPSIPINHVFSLPFPILRAGTCKTNVSIIDASTLQLLALMNGYKMRT